MICEIDFFFNGGRKAGVDDKDCVWQGDDAKDAEAMDGRLTTMDGQEKWQRSMTTEWMIVYMDAV